MINSIYTDDIHVVHLEMLPTSIQDFGGEYRIHRGYTEADAEKFIVDLDKAVENEKGLYVDAIAISRNVFESVCRDINSKLQELLPQQETIGLAEIYKHLDKDIDNDIIIKDKEYLIPFHVYDNTYFYISTVLNTLKHTSQIELYVDDKFQTSIPPDIEEFEELYNRHINYLRIKIKTSE